MRFIGRKKHHDFSEQASDLSFDEVLLDAGRSGLNGGENTVSIFERPFTLGSFYILGIIIFLSTAILFGRTIWLGGFQGAAYASRSENNRIERRVVEADRGVIYDRHGVPLVTNTWDPEAELTLRAATEPEALAHVLGFIGRPREVDLERDPTLRDFRSLGRDGIEATYDDVLRGEVGELLLEVNSRGEVISQGYAIEPKDGKNIRLTIDLGLQKKSYEALAKVADDRGFAGGALLAFNPEDGEILSLVSYPSFDINAFSQGISTVDFNKLISSKRTPLFNRAISGRYAPGSIMKPYFALAGLTEGTIDENDSVFSSGSIAVPNPYDPTKETVFKDWKAHGWVDVRRALEVSSNVFFYALGGGYEQIEGMGIDKITEWLEKFQFDQATGIDIAGEAAGHIPSRAYKAERHPDDPIWRIGDTYHASIGQGDTAITPISAIRALSALTTNGNFPTPHLLRNIDGEIKRQWKHENIKLDPEALAIVYEGMESVIREGTGSALSNVSIPMRGKTGTAEFGVNGRVHSWFMGVTNIPENNDQLGLLVFLESGARTNLVGGSAAALDVFQWIEANGGVEALYQDSD